jgi:peroxiredoxin
MPNNLTGDYDGVVQLSARQINGLLATLHQNAASEDSPLKLPHSVTLRVGDLPKSPTLEVRGEFREWLRGFQKAGFPQGGDKLRTHLAVTAPPGAAKMIEAAFLTFGKVKPPKKETRGTVRGRATLQISSPTISVTNGSTSEVTIHADVRAQYYPDAGTNDLALPKHPVHGEVRAVFDLRTMSSGTGRKLFIKPSSQNSKIQFIPAQGTNLNATEVARISAQVRNLIRERFTPEPVDLPSDFPFSAFKAFGSDSTIALPIQLSGTSLPAGQIQSLNHRFIDSSGCALALRKEYVNDLLDPLFDSIKDAIRNYEHKITVTLGIPPYTYTATITTLTLQLRSGPSLAWKSGHVELSAGLRLVVEPGPNINFSFKQKLKLDLHVSNQRVTVKPDGDPIVDTEIPFDFFHHEFVSAIKVARDQALSGSVNDTVTDTFNDAKKQLVKGLKSFDDSASATFTDIEITPDGVIVRGEIGSAARRAPIVQIAETDNGTAFTALPSWIPGGRIDRLIWSWTEHPGHKLRIWSGITKTGNDERHRFILPKPAGVTDVSSVSLRIEGVQTGPDGNVVNVEGASSSHRRHFFGPIIDAPPWWEPVTLPVWLPNSKPGSILKDSIAGHITLQSGTLQKNALTHNSLVYFADWRADSPLEPLVRALAAMKRQKVSLVLIVVLPAGAFDCRRSDAEPKLKGVPERFAGRLQLTEDNEGGWTRTFAASKTPSAYLINARREFVWKHEGEADPKVMAAALDKHLLPALAPRALPLRLQISHCLCHGAPDIVFEDDRGERRALHRMRGREVLLNFWQSWSAPCIKELERLERLHKQAGTRAPFIVAFHGGKDRKVIEKIRKQHKIAFPLVQDIDQRIARTYGVHCWPTTVSVNADGLISHVQFGFSPERVASSGRKDAASS